MQKTKEMKKNQNGITIVSLLVMILIMGIIISITVSTSLDRFQINKVQKMFNDINLLSDKISNYYLQYGGLPILRNGQGSAIEYTHTSLDFETNVNDNNIYYIIDLQAMEGISLNYGQEGYEHPNTSDDVYIINEASHVIYYVKGIEVDGVTYHTVPSDNEEFEDTVPPSTPQIKIISGDKNEEGNYTSPVTVEIIPGKDNGEGIEKTTYSINDGSEIDIATLENNMITIEGYTTHVIKVKSQDRNGNISREITQNITIEKINHSTVKAKIIAKTDAYNNANVKEVRIGGYGTTAVPIPTGFTYVEGDSNGGTVIIDDNDNEFVWIPVENINDMVMCQEHPTANLDETTLQCPTCGVGTKLAGKLYATQKGNYFTATTPNQTYDANSGLREPANLGATDYDNTTNMTDWNDTLYQTTFDSMAKSVAKYHGFYVGRYEMSKTTIDGKDKAQSKTGETSVSSHRITSNYANGVNKWYGLYVLAKTYTNEIVTSEMIWGSQYDAMMRWMVENGIDVKILNPTDLSIGETIKNTDEQKRTGVESKDKLSNIYDLLGNRFEWTQEAMDTEYRIRRGGYYGNSNASPSYRDRSIATNTNDMYTGCRMSLYINL